MVEIVPPDTDKRHIKNIPKCSYKVAEAKKPKRMPPLQAANT